MHTRDEKTYITGDHSLSKYNDIVITVAHKYVQTLIIGGQYQLLLLGFCFGKLINHVWL